MHSPGRCGSASSRSIRSIRSAVGGPFTSTLGGDSAIFHSDTQTAKAMPGKKRTQPQPTSQNRNRRRNQGGKGKGKAPPQRKQAQQPRARIQAVVANKTHMTRKLFLAMALPQENPNVRQPTSTKPRTSVFTATQIQTLDSSASQPLVIALYGQLGRMMMVKKPMTWTTTADAAYLYVLEHATTVGTNSLWSIDLPLVEASEAPFSRQLERPWHLAYGAGYKLEGSPTKQVAWAGPHGLTMPIGRANGKDWVFIEAGQGLRLTLVGGTQSGVKAKASFKLDAWTSGRSAIHSANYEVPMVHGQSNSLTIQIGTTGHYSLTIMDVSVQEAPVGTGVTSFTVATNLHYNAGADTKNLSGAFWGITSFSEANIHDGGDHTIAADARISACSLLASNTSALTGMSGGIIAARFSDTNPWEVTDADLADQKEKYSNPALQGVYTFLELTEYLLAFRDSTSGRHLTYDLDPDTFVNYIRISTPKDANSFQVTLTTTVEFRSNSQRYPAGIAHGDFMDFNHAASLVNARPEWFYHNPNHMQRVYQVLRDAARTAARYAPAAARIGGALDPVHAPQYNALSGLMQGLFL